MQGKSAIWGNKGGSEVVYMQGENEIWGDKEDKKIMHTRNSIGQQNIWKPTTRINVKNYEANRWSEHAADSHPHTLLVYKILL